MGFRPLPEWINFLNSLNNVSAFTLVIILVSAIYLIVVIKRLQFIHKVDKIPGIPGGITILGNASLLLNIPREGKRRLAFLDLLIDAAKDGEVLSDSDIREEVDTFMFEGHDTSTAAVNWSLFLIGSHPDVQDRVNEEIDRVFGDSDRPVTMPDLSELKYLECCLKEALRLYPSVPIIGRELTEDTVIHGYTIPARTTVLLVTYMLHRDSNNFPDPDLYQPERFMESNNRGRHPYSYVPFSAGPRNCIGQKFALMEGKIILSSIFRNFHVKSLDKREELILLNEVILRPRDGIRLKLTPKSKLLK